MATNEWRLFYDGGCNLCHVSKLRVEQWAERAHQPMRAIPLQSDEGLATGYAMDSMVLEAGEIFYGADAWIRLLAISPWWLRWMRGIARIPGGRSLLRWGYGIVARYRHRWFGTRACAIPPR